MIEKIKSLLKDAEAVLIGAGSGLSTSAGFTYSGERFYKYFSDFSKKYGFHDMYSGGFTDFENLEEYWGYWCRQIYVNRYMSAPVPVYEELFRIVKDKNYFVLTTNVDHCFQKSGFDKSRLFYTQGDYGLWQCSKPCHRKTYDNEETVLKMIDAENFCYEIPNQVRDDSRMSCHAGGVPCHAELVSASIRCNTLMTVPSELVPKCPECGKPMTMNLRCDGTFVEDEGWHKAAKNYEDFLNQNKNNKIVYLELGVGGNTPGIIKYPLWQMTYANPNARYICINKGEAAVPEEIEKQSICVNDDIFEVLKELR